MHRVKLFNFESRQVRLLPLHFKGGAANTYTVLVGKNGVGKSRLLYEIAKDCIDDNYYSNTPQPIGSGKPPKIIAASTSPFDKFPLTSRRVDPGLTNYRYIGMRSDNVFTSTSSIALISSAAKGLLENFGAKEQSQNLLNVFKTLNFSTSVELIFKPSYIGFRAEKTSSKAPWTLTEEEKDIEHKRNYIESKTGIRLEDKYLLQLTGMQEDKFEKVITSIKILYSITSEKRAIHLKLDFSDTADEIIKNYNSNEFSEADAFLILLGVGFIRLIDMILIKHDYGRMSVKKASSGEQCMLVLMLGIAGHIQNNSIILIDEPEISLHPKWQEDFMELLIEAFDSYEGCQFIVATHSPQIISKLQGDNCYIASLSKDRFFSAKNFKERSADYQLAELFEAPGLMNEYISRLAFSLLAKIKNAKAVTETNKSELKKLKSLISNTEKEDPLVELVKSVEDVYDYYDKNK
jgi:predicted ATPase